MGHLLTEAQIRRVIQKILFEQYKVDPQKTYEWNDVPEYLAKAVDKSDAEKIEAEKVGATKYRYSYNPGSGEIRLLHPKQVIVRQGTQAYNAIKKQFETNKDLIIGMFNEPLFQLLNLNLSDLMIKKSIINIYTIYDALEEFLDKGLDGEFGEKIASNLKDAYPNLKDAYPDELAKVGNFDEKSIRSMKRGEDISKPLDSIIFAPKLPAAKERFANLSRFITGLGEKVSLSWRQKMSVTPEEIAKTIDLSENKEVLAAARIAATKINAIFDFLYELFDDSTQDFARLGFAAGARISFHERDRALAALDRISPILS